MAPGLLFPDFLEKTGSLQGNIKEKRLGMGIPFHMIQRGVEQFGETGVIGRIDISRDLFQKFQFIPLCRHFFFVSEKKGGANPDHLQGIQQEVLLVFPADPGYLTGKPNQVNDLVIETEQHPLPEIRKIKLVLFDVLQAVQGLFQVPVRLPGDDASLPFDDSMFPDEISGKVIDADLWNLDQQGARTDGADNLVRIFGDQDEQRFFGRFLEDLQDLGRCGIIQLFHHPQDHHLVFRFIAFITQGMDDLVAVLGIDDPLFVLHPDEFVPFMQVHMVIVPDEEGSPLFEKIVAFRLFCNFFRGRYGKDEMQVGVNQLLVFYARRTGAARIGTIAGTAVLAVDELCIGDGQRQFFIAFRAEEQLGMAHTVIQNRLDQFLLDHFLPDDFAEPHASHLKSGSKFMGFPDGKDFFPNKFPSGVIA